jgi:hypothetical protein
LVRGSTISLLRDSTFVLTDAAGDNVAGGIAFECPATPSLECRTS